MQQLFDFQKKGVEFIIEKKKALIADEMGLGKTVQAITAITRLNAFPCLVICPKSVVLNWKNEIEKWDGTAKILDSKFEYATISQYENNTQFLIINYDIITKKIGELEKIPYKSIILDEIHYAKNYKAHRTKAVEHLLQRDYDPKTKQNSCIVIGLSGTPIINHGTEIHQIAKLINPYCLGYSFFTFATRYCVKDRFGYKLDTRKLDQLNERLHQIMIRRKKEEVLKDLPEKTRVDIEIDVNDLHYTNELRMHVQKLKENNMMDSQVILGLMSKERQLTGLLKTDKVVEFLLDMVAETDQKIVVFAHHTEVIKTISQKLKENNVENSIYIGEMPLEQRQQALDDFKNKNQVIIISIHAGGVGLNLQFANYVVFAELDWSPSQMQQAEDRCHRIGQKTNVTVYYLFAKGTIDENITNQVIRKMQVINAVIDDIEIQAENEKLNAYQTLLRSL